MYLFQSGCNVSIFFWIIFIYLFLPKKTKLWITNSGNYHSSNRNSIISKIKFSKKMGSLIGVNQFLDAVKSWIISISWEFNLEVLVLGWYFASFLRCTKGSFSNDINVSMNSPRVVAPAGMRHECLGWNLYYNKRSKRSNKKTFDIFYKSTWI